MTAKGDQEEISRRSNLVWFSNTLLLQPYSVAEPDKRSGNKRCVSLSPSLLPSICEGGRDEVRETAK